MRLKFELISENRFTIINSSIYLNAEMHDKSNKFIIYTFGYCIPKYDYSKEYQTRNSDLISELYKKYKSDFINFIKGSFVIVIYDKKQEKLFIFNDQLGIKNFYYLKDYSVISNDFAEVNKYSTGCFSEDFALSFLLTNQFLTDEIVKTDIIKSKPATYLEISENGVKEYCYYDKENFINVFNKNKNIKDIDWDYPIKVLNQSINQIKAKNNFITLTGGLDSRLVLSLLISNNIYPEAITYGNPASLDVIEAKDLCYKLGLKHHNVSINPSTEWFENITQEMMNNYSPLITSHRAHRYYTYKKIFGDKSPNTTIFSGYLGGEIIRSISFDGIIMNDFMHHILSDLNNFENTKKNEEFLRNKYININKDKFKQFSNRIMQNQILSDDYWIRHLLNILYVRIQHHIQDINLTEEIVDTNYSIYLDLDFIEFIISNPYNFSSHNTLFDKVITNNMLYCELISRSSNLISSFPIFKYGFFTPSELVNNNQYLNFIKRILRYKSPKKRYESNFKLDMWIYNYVKNQIKDNLPEIINQELLKKQFLGEVHQHIEDYWRKFTNPIHLKNIYLKYE